MLGMTFLSFLLLSIIAGAVAWLYHYALRLRFMDGIDALFGKMLIGWFGAWLGSPVLGHWLWEYQDIYIVPAILGAIAAIHLNVLGWKALAKAIASRPVAAETVGTKKAAA